MKYILTFVSLLTLLLVASCNGRGSNGSDSSVSVADSASHLMSNLHNAIEERRYDDARHLIDSLRNYMPTAIDARREAIVLADSIELLEARDMSAFLDTMLTAKRNDLTAMKRSFVFEQDKKYQSKGVYVLPKHAGSKTSLSFLPEVEEDGSLLLVSIDSKRRYSFTEVDLTDGYVIASAQLRLSAAQQQDVAKCYELASLMQECDDLAAQLDKWTVKVRFYEKKKQYK